MFNTIFAEMARKGAKPERILIDAAHLKAHRTAASLSKKGPFPTYRTKERGLERQTSHAVCSVKGRSAQ